MKTTEITKFHIIRDYLLSIGFNNKLLLDDFVEAIMNNDISEWTTLLNNDEVRDIKRLMEIED